MHTQKIQAAVLIAPESPPVRGSTALAACAKSSNVCRMLSTQGCGIMG
ncbi:hypothetical protein [Bordetella holmesii]|nr:hypothetical protein [Bordetella holmesii]QJP54476.1 hypothetical protein FYA36_17160 [Bordetella holmesii]QJP64159.1 hypothetical protein FYB63_17170 [Bordetella holmesii]QSY67545.1 hypothetical protein J3Q26_01015 [Bordetella holmesii]UEB20638.1 hypothetical protein LK440_00015 [Bordetella holmesii]